MSKCEYLNYHRPDLVKWLLPPNTMFESFLISVGKDNPGLGLTLVERSFFKNSALWAGNPSVGV